MKIKDLVVLAMISLALWSCKTAQIAPEISRAETKSMVTNPETTLVDVRIPEEYSEKTVDGAINIPLAEITQNLDFFRKQKQVIVFCNTGRQSREAVEVLKMKGITKVYTGISVRNMNAIKAEKK